VSAKLKSRGKVVWSTGWRLFWFIHAGLALSFFKFVSFFADEGFFAACAGRR
jgi:hypothetical protein